MTMPTPMPMPATTSTGKSVLGVNAEERDRAFAKLSQEDEEFRRKIVDLHRKLSDVDDRALAAVAAATTTIDSPSASSARSKEAERLRELESVARRAEETNFRNAEEMNAERRRESLMSQREGSVRSTGSEGSDRRRYRCRRQDQFLQRRSRRLDEEADEQNGASPSGETTFLNRLRIKRRSMKLLSFLSGKASDKSQEERAARLLRMYMPERDPKAQNTISIHHTSRDRRFWKLRSRRRNSNTA